MTETRYSWRRNIEPLVNADLRRRLYEQQTKLYKASGGVCWAQRAHDRIPVREIAEIYRLYEQPIEEGNNR